MISWRRASLVAITSQMPDAINAHTMPRFVNTYQRTVGDQMFKNTRGLGRRSK